MKYRTVISIIILLLILGGGMWFVLKRKGQSPSGYPVVTRGDLSSIKTAILLFYVEKEYLPKNEQDFISEVAKSPYFSGELDNPKEGIGYVDPRGNPYRYVYQKGADGKESFMVYSYGSNGIDEKGRGDDLSVECVPEMVLE